MTKPAMEAASFTANAAALPFSTLPLRTVCAIALTMITRPRTAAPHRGLPRTRRPNSLHIPRSVEGQKAILVYGLTPAVIQVSPAQILENSPTSDARGRAAARQMQAQCPAQAERIGPPPEISHWRAS